MSSSEKNDNPVNEVSSKVYTGIWGLVGRFLKVPREAPSLPVSQGKMYEAFKPARGYLNRLRLNFAVGAVFATVMFILGSIGVFQIPIPFAEYLAIPFFAVLEVVFLAFGFVAIHLRYDTIWYVMNDRSIRIRRGLWLIRESTITFENVQNVKVTQGPIQRFFGISNVLIETAGGGGAASPHGDGNMAAHHGLIEGVEDPHRIREMILARLRMSKSAGLGDETEEEETHQQTAQFSSAQIELLREIRDLAKATAHAS